MGELVDSYPESKLEDLSSMSCKRCGFGAREPFHFQCQRHDLLLVCDPSQLLSLPGCPQESSNLSKPNPWPCSLICPPIPLDLSLGMVPLPTTYSTAQADNLGVILDSSLLFSAHHHSQKPNYPSKQTNKKTHKQLHTELPILLILKSILCASLLLLPPIRFSPLGYSNSLLLVSVTNS